MRRHADILVVPQRFRPSRKLRILRGEIDRESLRQLKIVMDVARPGRESPTLRTDLTFADELAAGPQLPVIPEAA